MRKLDCLVSEFNADVSASTVELLGTIVFFTVILIGLLLAGFPDVHVALEVSTHVIISPLAGMQEYVGEFEPAFLSFFFHW